MNVSRIIKDSPAPNCVVYPYSLSRQRIKCQRMTYPPQLTEVENKMIIILRLGHRIDIDVRGFLSAHPDELL